MMGIVYINGRYRPYAEASVHFEDRGYQFADGIYEVIYIYGGHLIDGHLHLDRLSDSLQALRIDWPVTRRALELILLEVIRRNKVREGQIYIQITRGVATRNHPFPRDVIPSLVIFAKSVPPWPEIYFENGVTVITTKDIRWRRPDIKSISLLPNVLAKQEAYEKKAFEAWLVDDKGMVTEGSSTNAWIVTRDGLLVTPAANGRILNGITRKVVLATCQAEGIRVEERPFSVDEAKAAREAFLTSTTSFVLPIVQIDGQPVANGAPGLLSRQLLRSYRQHLQTVLEEGHLL